MTHLDDAIRAAYRHLPDPTTDATTQLVSAITVLAANHEPTTTLTSAQPAARNGTTPRATTLTPSSDTAQLNTPTPTTLHHPARRTNNPLRRVAAIVAAAALTSAGILIVAARHTPHPTTTPASRPAVSPSPLRAAIPLSNAPITAHDRAFVQRVAQEMHVAAMPSRTSNLAPPRQPRPQLDHTQPQPAGASSHTAVDKPAFISVGSSWC
jgi:hypothetical protein